MGGAGPYLGIEVGEGSTHPIEAQPLAELGDLHNGPREIEERVEGGSVCVEGADGSRIRVARRRHERRHGISMSNPSEEGRARVTEEEVLADGAYQDERAYGEDDGLAATSLLPLPRRREEVLPLPAHAALSGWATQKPRFQNTNGGKATENNNVVT